MAQISFFFALLTGFFIPISTAATNVGLGLTLLFYILSGQLFQTGQWLAKQAIAWTAFALLVCVFVGTFYSLADGDLVTTFIAKYLKFLALLIFLPLIYRHIQQFPQHRTWGLNALLFALLVTLILSYFLLWFDFNLSFIKGHADAPVPFKNYIVQSILLAFAGYAGFGVCATSLSVKADKKSGYLVNNQPICYL